MVIAGQTIRERIAEIAMNYVGCGVTERRERYLGLVSGPGDPPSSNVYFASPATSGCALTVRGIWREAGSVYPRLLDPYRIGHAVDDIVTTARQAGAWINAYERRGRLPGVGDAVIVGGSGHEHCYTVVRVDLVPNCIAELRTVDGGQKDALGNQIIGARVRRWLVEGEHLADRTIGAKGDLGAGVVRPVQGWVDVERLEWPALKECC